MSYRSSREVPVWWLGLVALGVLGIAAAILDELRRNAGRERQHWHDLYQGVESDVSRLAQRSEQELRRAQHRADFQRLAQLHFEFVKTADQAYEMLRNARVALDGLGKAIRDARIERDRLIAKKRQTRSRIERDQYEQEIRTLQELRQQLIPDKEQLKAQRDALLRKVKHLNAQTHALKVMVRDRCGVRGRDWYNRLEERTDRRRRGLPPKRRVRGIVKWYDENRGFGFIAPAAGGEDVYVHWRNLRGVSGLWEGDMVEFSVRLGDKGP